MKINPNQQNNLETQLILDCSQTRLNSQQTARVSNVLSESPDWDFVLNIAAKNGLLPIICWNLLQKFSDLLDPEIKNLLSQTLQKQTKKNLFLTQQLIEIVKILEKVEIPILPFKGTTLAMQAYGNLALRDYCDLDILIQPKHFDEAVRVLSQNGFAPIGKINRLKRNILFFNTRKDVGLVGKNEIVRIELHWKLSGSHFAMPLEIDELWKRLETINLGGTELYALPFNDLFIYLCLHGSRHAWEKLSWICDLHELILTTENSGKKINWIEVQKHAENYGCVKVLELGLFLVHEFYNLKTNFSNFEQIQNNSAYEKIAEQVKRKAFSKNKTSSNIDDWYLYHLSLKERKIDQLKLHLRYFFWYLKIIFKPNSLDKSVFHLPNFLYPIYYILRPIRLLFGYFNLDSKKKITSD